MTNIFLFTFPGIKHKNIERLNFTKTEDGWNISGTTPHSGNCDPDGGQLLILNFRQNDTFYPNRIDLFLERIWQDLEDNSINETQAQARFDDLGAWLKGVNSSKPQWKGYNT
ncbi:hypothetical protein GGR41_000547 [Paenalcaligenes hominis]|uniref:Uncharacterized protein n=1 Tax=Paenalcaligenes hominis TaxID=643674 RepID=A0ABX0WPU9_9BURK|nr:hypothetical protein [Paenalcaligenes hominis]NJB64326.1 hypothetical protein [Paenalcaligenes hominis]GGE68519.1 hypothetical protein GCM10007278_15740 [Paenalcaligenes hominis]